MAEHDELVAEMPILEQMGTQERQKLAKKRRLQQLKKWSQREKEWIAKEKQLNKRLANIINEENNGLNLKQYTAYGSNQRVKKKSNQSKSSHGASNNIDFLNNNHPTSVNGNKINGHRQKYLAAGGRKNDKNFAANGKVHFDVGVMLLEAAARNDFDEVKRLLSLGVSPDSINHDGLTALHQCCIDASEPIMNLLLEYGANVDARDTEQWTPLHAACTCGHLNLVKILVQYDADLLAVNGDCNMPFDICEDEATLNYIESEMVKQGITQEMIDLTRASAEMSMLNELEKRLSDRCQELNFADQNGVTYLHIAAANNYISAVKFMLKHGVNVNVCDNDFWTPLHGAACWGCDQHVKVVELLVEAGASLDAKTMNDETVFDLCDNIDLLEKLNQLKDDLENRQETGGDRLRRTQSRTNSRVHSVRRTSVRDKNQISRREAREEALLRVESETISTTTTNGSVSRFFEPTTEILVDDRVFSSLNVGEPSGPEQNNEIRATLNSDTNNPRATDRVDSSAPVTTDLDSHLEDGSIGSSRIAPTPTANNSQKGSQSDDSDTLRSTLVNEKSFSQINGLNDEQRKAKIMNEQLCDESLQTSDETARQSKIIDNEKIIESYNSSRGLEHNFNDERGPSFADDKNSLTGAQNDISKGKHQTNVDIIQNQHLDFISNQQQSTSRSQSQTTTVQVQFTPINYTLSNLKKHRSDLRMRTCSIGGSNIISNSISHIVNSNGADMSSIVITANGQVLSNQKNDSARASNGTEQSAIMSIESKNTIGGSTTILMNPEPNESLHSSTLNRPGSPSLIYRKFHGEPSEVVGDTVGKGGHKCCIIM